VVFLSIEERRLLALNDLHVIAAIVLRSIDLGHLRYDVGVNGSELQVQLLRKAIEQAKEVL